MTIHTATPVAATVPPPDSIWNFAGGLGQGTATLLGQMPQGVAVRGTTLYVADNNANAVRAVNLTTGDETVVAGGVDYPGCVKPCLATSAWINPQGIAADAAGNLYITDFGVGLQGQVWKVDTGGTMSAFAGGGPGCNEPCPATQAQTILPADVTVDGSGNVYFADSGANVVRKVDTGGNITTVAGNGTYGSSGDGGSATAAELAQPYGVAVDGSGNIFISDYANHRVRKVDHTTGNISSFAGTNGTCFTWPCPAQDAFFLNLQGLRTDAAGNVYVADFQQSRVFKIDAAGTTVSGYAGCGCPAVPGDGVPAALARVDSPSAVALDASGNLFIAEFYGDKVRRVDHTTLLISTVAGNGADCGPVGDGGQAIDAQVCSPTGFAMDAGNNLFFVAKDRVRKITAAGVISTVAGGGTGCTEPCAATAQKLTAPVAVALNAAGDLFIAETARIHRVDHVTGNITTYAGTGVPGYNGDGQPATSAMVSFPSDVALNSTGDLFIADLTNQRVRMVDHATGNIATVAGTGVAGFSGDGGPASLAQLSGPNSVAVDSAGNLYIADSGNYRLRKLAGGTITTFAGGGAPNCPVPGGEGEPALCMAVAYVQLATDTAGRVYMADGNFVQVVTADGFVSRLSGCTYGFDAGCQFTFADGVPATTAQSGAASVAVDSNFNAYIGGTRHIYRVQVPVAPSAPTSPHATPQDSKAVVTWAPPASSGGNHIYRYTVTPFEGANALSSVQVTGVPLPTTTTIPLLSGPSYTFRITATNAFGTSAFVTSNAVVPSAAPPGKINTHAGSVGTGPPTSLGQVPFSLAINPTASRLYIGDWANAVVRSVDLGTNIESSLAGEAVFGYSGDGGPATAATILGAGAMVTCGNVTYIADTDNYVIRKVDASGVITRFAGTGTRGYSGDGGPALLANIDRVFGLACRSAGGLYVADTGNGAVRIIDGAGKITTWWYGFAYPVGIAEEDFNLGAVVSDAATNVIWHVDDNSAYILAGTGVAGFNGDNILPTHAKLNEPWGIAYRNGLIFVADSGNNRIRLIQPFNNITTLVGNGTAGFQGDGGDPATAELNGPTNLLLQDFYGSCGPTLYIADANNFRVRSAPGLLCSGVHTISTLAGNGTPSLSGDGGQALDAQLGNPYAVAVDSAGNQYIADNQNNVIRKIDPLGVITTLAGNGVAGFGGDNGPATSAQLQDPRGVAIDVNGDVYISDTGNQVIRKVDHTTGHISTIAGTPGAAGFGGDGGPPSSAKLNYARAVAVDDALNVYIADTGNNRVRIISGGSIGTLAGTGTAGFSGDNGPASNAMLNGPRGLAVDASRNVFISDSKNNRVREVDHTTGNIATVAGTGVAGSAGDNQLAVKAQLSSPFGLALDAAHNLYVADTLNERIRIVRANGVIETAVGGCGILAAWTGDGGLASLAHMNTPFGIAVDQYNNLYVAEVNSNRVRGATALAQSRAAACPGLSHSAPPRMALFGPRDDATHNAVLGLPTVLPRSRSSQVAMPQAPSRAGRTASGKPQAGAAPASSSMQGSPDAASVRDSRLHVTPSQPLLQSPHVAGAQDPWLLLVLVPIAVLALGWRLRRMHRRVHRRSGNPRY